MADYDETEFTKFYGVVIFRNYMWPPWHDGPLSGVIGECRIKNTEEILGFRTHSPDVNWGILVTGRTLTQFVPGCQVLQVIRCDTEHNPDLNLNDQIQEVP